MHTHALKAWRTVIVALCGLGCLLVGYRLGLYWSAGPALFPVFAGAVCTIVGIGAAKSSLEHFANKGKPDAGAA